MYRFFDNELGSSRSSQIEEITMRYTNSYTSHERRVIHQQLFREGWATGPKWGNGEDIERYTYLHLSELWPHSIIPRAGTVRELPKEPNASVAMFPASTRQGDTSLDDYVQTSTVDGAIVLHRGRIVYESYPSMSPTDKHIWFSVSKTLIATAIAILEESGEIDSTMEINHYFPKLNGSDWQGVPLIDVLDMASGIDCVADFDNIGNADDCFNRSWMAYGFPWNSTEAIDEPLDFFAAIPSRRPPGEVFEYGDISPLILTLLVEQVGELAFPEFISKYIWQKIGADSDATLMCNVLGRPATPLGVSSTLRDLARFGLAFISTEGESEYRFVSESYISKIQNEGRPKLLVDSNVPNLLGDNSLSHNTRHWDHVTDDGDFYKSGAYGQGLYISPKNDVVIAFFSTGNKKDGIFGNDMPRIARQLTKSDILQN